MTVSCFISWLNKDVRQITLIESHTKTSVTSTDYTLASKYEIVKKK